MSPSPTPPERELIAQIVRDAESDEPPTGSVTYVYCRLYRDLTNDNAQEWRTTEGQILILEGVNSEYGDPSTITYHGDFVARSEENFTRGDHQLDAPSAKDVSGLPTKFYSDGTYE